MSDSFDQHGAQRPSPSLTGSQQEGQSRGKAKSRATRRAASMLSLKRAPYDSGLSGLADTSSFMLEP